MNLYSAFIALRLIPLDGASYGEAAEYAMNINAFPLSRTGVQRDTDSRQGLLLVIPALRAGRGVL